MITTIIADDHHLVRSGIRLLLEKVSDIDVVAEVEDGLEAIAMVERLIPDVVVMDITMPRMNGIEATAQVEALGLKTQVVILSMHSDSPLVRQALKMGAKGYVLKRSVSEELVLAIRAASKGEIYLCSAITAPILNDLLTTTWRADVPTSLDRLTPRERQVLQLIAEGNTNRAAAQVLGLSVKTIEKHRSNIKDKLGIYDLVGLIRFALRNQLIQLEE